MNCFEKVSLYTHITLLDINMQMHIQIHNRLLLKDHVTQLETVEFFYDNRTFILLDVANKCLVGKLRVTKSNLLGR